VLASVNRASSRAGLVAICVAAGVCYLILITDLWPGRANAAEALVDVFAGAMVVLLPVFSVLDHRRTSQERRRLEHDS
jgi:hypothetical protein